MLSENIIIIDNLSGTVFIVSVVDTNKKMDGMMPKKLDQIEKDFI